MLKIFGCSRKTMLMAALLLVSVNLSAQIHEPEKAYKPISMSPFSDSRNHWYGIHDDGNIVNPVANQPKYQESEITKIADNILLYQRDNGGWPKNYDMQAILTPEQVESLIKTKAMVHTTFDNQTTYPHIEYLARVFQQTQIKKYREAALKGIRFMLSAQYPNGGWPQYFPIEKDNYSSHITFNDGAFLGVMETLRKIKDKDPIFSFVDEPLRKTVNISYDKGIDCILKLQITSRGRLTAWAQQYDEFNLKPAWARAYEMPSITNGESAQLVLFLMSLDHPDQKIIQAVQAAIKWFNESKIYNIRVKTIQAPSEKSHWRTITTDRIVIVDSMAPPIWTRFYEIETEKPLFSDRNSKLLYSLAEVGRERRNGYGWYTYAPQEALEKYPEWQRKWAPDRNVLAK